MSETLTAPRHTLLSIFLVLIGIAFIALYGMTVAFPASWMWQPRQAEYEQMILGIYIVLGIFLLLAARAPEKHLSLIWFAAVSSIVHGGIMFVQAVRDPLERPHFFGDVPAMLIIGIILVILTPKRLA